MAYTFKVGDEGKTRSGNKYRVLCVDARSTQPVLAELMSATESHWYIESFWSDGRYHKESDTSGNDLMPPTRKVWVNIYPHGGASYYSTRETADLIANCERLFCVEIEIPQE